MTVLLNDLCELIVDCEHRTAEPTADGTYPLIRTPDIGLGVLLVDRAQRVNGEAYRAWTKRAVPRPGDLILAREAPVGNVGIVPPGVEPVLGQRTVLIRTDEEKLHAKYLNYLLSAPDLRGWMEGVSIGATVPHLNMADIRGMPMPPLPPLSIQRKVAAILSAHDDLIENNNRRIKILEEIAERIYREWFVDFRYPGRKSGDMIDSELGAIPLKWDVCTLSSLCTTITDGAHASPESTHTGLPMASVKDMADWSLDISGCRLISEPDFFLLQRQGCQPRAGDVLISKDGAKCLDKVFPIWDTSQVVLLSSIAILRPAPAVGSAFLTMLLRDRTTKSRLSNRVSGAAIPRVVLRDFKNLQIVLPPSPLLARFDAIVDPVLRLAVTLEAANRTLRDVRDLLLPRLISGDINVEGLDIGVEEPAA